MDDLFDDMLLDDQPGEYGPDIEIDNDYQYFANPYWAIRKAETIHKKAGSYITNFSVGLTADLFMLGFAPDAELKRNQTPPKGTKSLMKSEYIESVLNSPNIAQKRAMMQGDIQKCEQFASALSWVYMCKMRHVNEDEITDDDRQMMFDSTNDEALDVLDKTNVLLGLMPGNGCSSGPGTNETLDMQVIKQVASSMNEKSRLSLARIIEFLGRITPISNALQKEKAQMPHGEVHNIVPSGNISKMTSREKMNFATHGMLRTEAIARLADNKLSTYETHAETGMGKGDVVLFLDESGSMFTEQRINMGKAIALMVASNVLNQGRNIRLIGFADYRQVYNRWSSRDGDTPEKLLEWMISMNAGGTCFREPFIESYELPEIVDGDSDLIVITDAMGIPMLESMSQMEESRNLRKSVGCSTTIIQIGSDNEDVDLLKEYLGDAVFCVETLDEHSEAVREVLLV